MKNKLSGILALLMVLVVQIGFAQEGMTVTGTVTDDTGLPLPGVNVLVQGTSRGTQTDFDGNYSIEASEGEVLVFSYLGMATVQHTVRDVNTIDVILEPDAAQLQEVVVTALGIERNPRELAYSVASIDNEDLTETRSSNVATAMIGKVAGLQINTTNNGVNPSTRVVLRGNRSLLGNNQALIVIDGYPTTRGALDRLNPDDISEVTVLKGANASALYGSEAANGVLVITTKTGKGKMNVTFTTSYQHEQISYFPELQDEFGVGGFPDGTLWPLENVNWGPRFDGRLVAASETLEDGSVWEVPFTPIEDNHLNFFNTGTTIRNGITVSGGDEESDFLFSVDHSNVEGVVPRDQYNRTNARLNAGRDFGRLEVGANVSFFRSHSNVVGRDQRQNRPLFWFVLNTPLHIPLDQMRNWRTGTYTRNETSFYRFYENPYFILDTQRVKSDVNEFTFIADADYEFTDWLSTTLQVGYTNYNTTYKEESGGLSYEFHVPHPYAEIQEYGPSTEDEMYNLNRLNSDFIVTIDKEFSDYFQVTSHLGYNLRLQNNKTINVSGTNLLIPGFYNVGTRTGNLMGFEGREQYRKMGAYADLTIGIGDYLFLTGTARNDWTSALAKGNRSYFYPGAGVSFIPTEAFPSIKGTLNYLKGSFNITKTGNDPDPYETNRTFRVPNGGADDYGNFPYGSTPGLALSDTEPSLDLKPEFTTSLEAGIEFGFFRGDRISGNVTVYKTNSTDQLVPINTSVASGVRSVFTNLGEIENRGLEIGLNGTVIRSDDLTWNIGVNYAKNDSEVLSLTEGVNELEIGGNYVDNAGYGAVIVAQVGQPYPLLKTTDYVRDDQGRVVVGADGDPIEDTNLQVQGQTTPDYTVGLNTSLRYKGFSLYAVMDYRTGHVFYNNLVDALEFTGLTKHSVASDRQPFVFPNSVYENENGEYVENTNRETTGGGNQFWDTYSNTKSNYVTDATTLKLREVSLNYSLDEEILDNLGIQGLRIGLYGRNLFMWTPAENVYTDPEFNYSTGNAVGFGTQAQVAPTRQYGLTLTANF